MRRDRIRRWSAGILALVLVLTSLTIPELRTQAEEAALPRLTVDMSQSGQRDLYHGATGWLYGQGDDQVPTANTITALKPNTAVQKAPNGMQHPNGDVLDIAKTFLDAGGKHIQIYVPDYYALWFYEFTGTEYYLDILEMQAKECIEAGIAEEAVYVLYNEPTANWIGGTYKDHEGNVVTGWDSMNWFWLDMVEKLREVYKEAGIQTPPKTAGLNLAGYDNTVMENYIKFCAQNDCMPDIVSWHDLSTWQYNNFKNEYNHYRGLEKKYGVEPREIVINEYAAQYECSSPGDLVRWIGLWEDYQVAGCLPFWHFSNNLNGLAADTNEGNGAWWLYKWYGDMSGSYLPVAVSGASQDDFYGAASIDENKKSANVIFGGRQGSSEIVLDGINETQTFADAKKVHVKVESTNYTGFHGAAEEPEVVMEGALDVVEGKAVLPMWDMNALSAYHVTITQAAEDETSGMLSGTWRAVYEAEDGVLTGNAKVAEADGNYACSNRKKVHFVDNPGDSVTVSVNVPKDGYYKYDMVYCAATGVNTNDPANNTPYTAIQNLYIDGELKEEMILPSTLHWSMGGMYSSYLYLKKGSHSLKVEAASSKGKAVPDCFYLTYQGKEMADTDFDKTYEAELGEFNEIKGETTTLTTVREGKTGYITGLESRSVTEGGGVRFNVVVPDNGMYTLSLSYQADTDAEAKIYLDNDIVNLDRLRSTLALTAASKWSSASKTLFLQKGINVVDLDTNGPIRLDSMRIRAAAEEPAAAVEAESGELHGEAALGKVQGVQTLASGGSYVGGLKAANGVELIPEGDKNFTILGLGRQVDLGKAVDENNLTIHVNVKEAGQYKMLVYQSNGELFGKHSYNAQMTERYATFKVNSQEPQKVVFRNTYSEETFRPQVVNVTLQAGDNTISVYNDNSKVVTNGVLKQGTSEHRPENIDYSVLTNYTPNLDKFEFYAVTGETQDTPEETEQYQITAKTTNGGQIDMDKARVQKGEAVRLTFQAEDGFVMKDARVNGESIMDSLYAFGGVYTLTNVTKDVQAEAYFEAEERQEAVRETDFEYSVNAGDINPVTLSEGDSFGVRNSVTEQFYGADPATGKQWGLLETLVPNASYPGWLTGQKTWPCENDGAGDSSPRTKSFRYARNQATSDVGIVYQFELEPNQTYDLELGFYVPASWTNSGNPRTMKLVINDVLSESYKKFTASNDSQNPYVIRTTGTADENGSLKIQIGHGENAVWGPVISYLDILRQPDTSQLSAAVEKYEGFDSKNYTEASWTEFESARTQAEDLLQNSQEITNISPIHDALYELERTALNLKSYVDLTALKEECKGFQTYVSEIGQSLTSDKDWNIFCDILDNAVLLTEQTEVSADEVKAMQEKLSAAAGKLRTIKKLSVKAPDKKVYIVGEGLDTTGMEVTVTDNQDRTSVLDSKEYTIGEFNFTTPGIKEIQVSYKGAAASFTVQVKEAPVVTPVLRGIAASTSKTVYLTGDRLDLSTIRVTAVYSDGSSKTVDGFTVSGFDSAKAGKKTLRISYQGHTVSLTLTIQARTVQKPASVKIKTSKTGYNSITIQWKKTVNATGYQVYRGTKKNGKYSLVKTISGVNTVSYKNSGLKFGQTYYYKVRAVNQTASGKVYGDYSNVLKGKTSLEKPVLKLTGAHTGKVKATYQKTAGASGYQIRYSSKKNSGYHTISLSKNKGRTLSVGSYKKGKTCYVKIRAYRTVKEKKVYGSWSALKSLKIR